MSGFDAAWLALREPFDRAGRAAAAGPLALHALATPLRAGSATLGVLDLGCGTGANLRELAPRLGGDQHWLLVDHDPQLLAALPERLSEWAGAQGAQWRTLAPGRWRIEAHGWHATLATRQMDLATALDSLPMDGVHLVTASALLDLVSAPWLLALVERAAQAGAALLCALNVDGRLDWNPALADDARIHALFAAHQRRDKGFGPALGADAVALAATHLAARGYALAQAPSDWDIGPGVMLLAMIDGLAAAAMEQEPGAHAAVQAWRDRRRALAAQTRLRVGHTDLLGRPPA